MIALQKYYPAIDGNYEYGTFAYMEQHEKDGEYYKAEDVDPLLKELEELRNYKKFIESEKS
jgi:hypothetical protein